MLLVRVLMQLLVMDHLLVLIWGGTQQWDLPIWVATQQWDQPIRVATQQWDQPIWPVTLQWDLPICVVTLQWNLPIWVVTQQWDQPIWVVTQQWDQRKVHLTRYLVTRGQLVLMIQQWDLICLQATQWASRDQWMVDQVVIMMYLRVQLIQQWIQEWPICILTWMMQQLMVQVIQDQEHQTLWPVTWMEMV
jgi:hypothetical protein